MASPPPLFIATVQEIRPHPHFEPLSTQEGHWRPRRSRGLNVPLSSTNESDGVGSHNQFAYYLDIHTQRLKFDAGFDPSASGNLALRRTTSLYHHNGNIYTVDASALDWTIGQEDFPLRRHPAPIHPNNWQLLNFAHPHRTHSKVKYGSNHTRLHGSSFGRPWVNILLPHGHQPEARTTRTHDANTELYGALRGDVSALLGLVVLSAHPSDYNVHNALIYSVNAGCWSIQPQSDPRSAASASAGWLDKRGVVIKVYTVNNDRALRNLEEYERRALIQ